MLCRVRKFLDHPKGFVEFVATIGRSTYPITSVTQAKLRCGHRPWCHDDSKDLPCWSLGCPEQWGAHHQTDIRLHFDSKFGLRSKSQAGCVNCLEPWTNHVNQVIISQAFDEEPAQTLSTHPLSKYLWNRARWGCGASVFTWEGCWNHVVSLLWHVNTNDQSQCIMDEYKALA